MHCFYLRFQLLCLFFVLLLGQENLVQPSSLPPLEKNKHLSGQISTAAVRQLSDRIDVIGMFVHNVQNDWQGIFCPCAESTIRKRQGDTNMWWLPLAPNEYSTYPINRIVMVPLNSQEKPHRTLSPWRPFQPHFTAQHDTGYTVLYFCPSRTSSTPSTPRSKFFLSDAPILILQIVQVLGHLAGVCGSSGLVHC